MKQFIVLLLICVGGYYLYTHGLSAVMQKANLNPREITQDGKIPQGPGASRVLGLPEIAPERSSGLKISTANLNLVETAVINTYDAAVCFAFVEMVYASGSAETPKVINKYLSIFDLPEDKNKLLPLLTKYKDRQTLKILEDLMNRGVFSRKMLLKKISEYNTQESLDSIKRASESKIAALQADAKQLYNDLRNWDKESEGTQTPTAHRRAALMSGEGGY